MAAYDLLIHKARASAAMVIIFFVTFLFIF